MVSDQVTVGRVEPEQAEGLAADHGVHQVAVQHAIQQCLAVFGTLLVILDCVGLNAVTPECMSSFS